MNCRIGTNFQYPYHGYVRDYAKSENFQLTYLYRLDHLRVKAASTIELCLMNFSSYRAKISKGFYAGVQTMTVHIIEVEYGNCGLAVN